MKPARHLDITTAGRNQRGDLVLDVRIRRRTIGAVRLFYRTARRMGVGRIRSAGFAVRLSLVTGDHNQSDGGL